MWTVDWEMVLKFAQLLLAWPFLAAVVLVCFMRRFDGEIRVFLLNTKPHLPGIEAQGPVQQLPPLAALPASPAEAEPKESEGAAPDLPPPSDDGDVSFAEGQDGGITFSVEMNPHLLSPEPGVDPEAEKDRDFRPLNTILAFNTQTLLDILSMGEGDMPIAVFNHLFDEAPADQRHAMLTILYQHGLVSVDDGIIQLTPRGRDYVNWPPRRSWVAADRAIWTEKAKPARAPILTPPTEPLEKVSWLRNRPPPPAWLEALDRAVKERKPSSTLGEVLKQKYGPGGTYTSDKR